MSSATTSTVVRQDPPATIRVRWQREGWHFWANAPEHRAYLGRRHRHVFHVEVALSVNHDDRDVEFHDLMDFTKKCWPVEGSDLGGLSCEMIARSIGRETARRYGRAVTVQVWEDGECGAEVTVTPWQAH